MYILLFLTTFVTYRMKEQLIKELVKTGREATVMNKQYEDKIKGLERVCIWGHRSWANSAGTLKYRFSYQYQWYVLHCMIRKESDPATPLLIMLI